MYARMLMDATVYVSGVAGAFAAASCFVAVSIARYSSTKTNVLSEVARKVTALSNCFFASMPMTGAMPQ